MKARCGDGVTITEVANYTLWVYVEQGWITPKQAKQMKVRDSIMFWGLFIMFWGLFVVFLLGVTLLCAGEAVR